MKTLPPFIDEMLTAPPRAGEGVHDWLFRVARQVHAHLPAVEIVNLLENRVQGCGRHVSRKEIEDAVKNSMPCAWQPKGNAAPVQSAAKWPRVNQEQRAAILRDNGGLADLWELSKPRIEDNWQHTEEIMDKLFPGNPLLCCGKSNRILTPSRAKTGAVNFPSCNSSCRRPCRQSPARPKTARNQNTHSPTPAHGVF